MSSSNSAIPLAIVCSSVIVALGLFFGLRGPSTPASPVVVTTPSAVTAEPAALAPIAVDSDRAEVEARAAENGRLALEAVRAGMVERCWTPAAAQQPEPRQVPLVFNLSFSAQGQLVAFGISEDRAVNRSEVAECLRRLELQLRVPAPGRPLSVEVPITLP